MPPLIRRAGTVLAAASLLGAPAVLLGRSAVWAATTMKPLTIGGVVYVANAAELEYIDDSLAAHPNSSPFGGATIDLTADITLPPTLTWVPWRVFSGTLNGNGYTLQGLTINASPGRIAVGLVGQLTGTIEHLGVIAPSVADSNPLGGPATGALVGAADPGATITDVYVQGGTVTLGRSHGVVGGLVGLLGTAGLGAATLHDVYSTAAVSAALGTTGGGLIGTNSDGFVSGGVWDVSTQSTDTGISGAVGSGSSTGIARPTGTQMRTATPYSTWNFTTRWQQSPDQLPTLRMQSPTVPSLRVMPSPGGAGGTTALTLTGNSAADTFAVVGSNDPVPLGATIPVGATAYVSGHNLAASPNETLTIYEVTPAGAVDALTTLTLTASDVKAALPGLAIASTTLPAATVGSAYDHALQASGGSGSDTWHTVGSWPPWLHLSVAGVLSGTPTASGKSTFTVDVTDRSGATATQALTLTVQAASPPPPSVWTPPGLTPETVTVDGHATEVIGNLGANPPAAIQYGSLGGYVEERAAIGAGASFAGEGTDSSYLSAILDGSGVGSQAHVSATQQGQFAALYQKLGIIPTWTDNTIGMSQGVAALVKAGAPTLAIENYLVQLDGFSWAAAQAQAALGFPITAGT